MFADVQKFADAFGKSSIEKIDVNEFGLMVSEGQAEKNNQQ